MQFFDYKILRVFKLEPKTPTTIPKCYLVKSILKLKEMSNLILTRKRSKQSREDNIFVLKNVTNDLL